MLETTFTYVTDHGKAELVSNQPGASPLLTSTHCAARNSACHWKRKAITRINQLQIM